MDNNLFIVFDYVSYLDNFYLSVQRTLTSRSSDIAHTHQPSVIGLQLSAITITLQQVVTWYTYIYMDTYIHNMD